MVRNKLNPIVSFCLNLLVIFTSIIVLAIPQASVRADAAGYALYFDGINDYVDLGLTEDVMAGADWRNTMSFSLWLKPEGTGFCTHNDVASCDSIFGDRPRWWGLSHGTYNGQQGLFAWIYDGNYDIVRIPYTPGEWVHVAWVHTGGVLSVYKNGTLVGSVASGTIAQPPAQPRMHIGAVIKSSVENWSFNGEIDELRIYNTALTQNDIRASLFSELNGNEAGLQAYYKMSNGSGSVLTDDSGNGHNGLLLESEFILSNSSLPLWVTSTAFNKPLVNDFSITTNEDTPASATLLAQSNPASTLTYATSDPQHGTLTGTAPNLTYTPNLDYFGTDSFTYQALDGSSASAIATVSVTINPINDAPVAQSETWSVIEDTTYNGVLHASDVENDTLNYSIVTPPTHGSLDGTAPNLTYTPHSNYFGSDSFTFKANDTQLDSNIATITINISAVNDVPVADDKIINTGVNTPVSVTLTGSDIETSELTFSVTGGPSHGALSGTLPNLTYTPLDSYTGSDSFTYTASDGQATSLPATVTININFGNAPPQAYNQSLSTDEDIDLAITLSGSDPESQPLTYTVLAQPQHGSLTGTEPNLIFHPEANYFGPDSFTFKVNDGQIDSNIATITITINPVNDAPVANSQTKSTNVNQSVAITLTGSDIENDPLTFSVVGQPQHGNLSGDSPNLTYTPAADYNGADSFTYRAFDGNLFSAEATVSITVAATNQIPIAYSQDVEVDEDGSLPIVLTGSDPEGQPLTYAFNTPPSHGSLLGTAPNMIYTPHTNYYGTDFFVFRVRDGVNWSAPATVTITVLPVNDAPRGISTAYTLSANSYLDITLTGTDVDGDLLSFDITVSPQKGTLSAINPITNVVRYTPDSGYVGADVFRFRAWDGQVWSLLPDASISLNIQESTGLPVAHPDSYLVPMNGSLTVSTPGVRSNDVGADTVVLVDNVSHGDLSLQSDGSFTYTPTNGFSGIDQFTYYAVGTGGNSATVTVTLNIAQIIKVFLPIIMK